MKNLMIAGAIALTAVTGIGVGSNILNLNDTIIAKEAQVTQAVQDYRDTAAARDAAYEQVEQLTADLEEANYQKSASDVALEEAEEANATVTADKAATQARLNKAADISKSTVYLFSQLDTLFGSTIKDYSTYINWVNENAYFGDDLDMAQAMHTELENRRVAHLKEYKVIYGKLLDVASEAVKIKELK